MMGTRAAGNAALAVEFGAFDETSNYAPVASKETLARWVSLSRSLCDPRRRDRSIGKVGVLYRQWCHWKFALNPPFPKLLEVMQFILKVPEKSVPHVVNHGCGSQRCDTSDK
ncbi:hypothetical protein ILYODFUR_038710 [Ilyodon furcidens]|uniref:Uncharacterized protein n=1 Tax=Ilyodon furcidens TaxID=33524 RepID=A0ABV0UMW2_9TELE